MTEEYNKGYEAGVADANVRWELKLREFVAWLKTRVVESKDYAGIQGGYELAMRGVIVRLRKLGISFDD
jgi:hypothetical protein